MKSVIVFDVPAEKGGALSILNYYYNEAIKKKNINWIFIVSVAKLEPQENIKILNFPWIKKSWLHRLYFDFFVSNKLVKEHKVDEVLSLQNIIIRNAGISQTLYFHQALPFAIKKFSLFKNMKLWVYQNIISIMIFDSLKKADHVIVQTNWIKNACVEKLNLSSSKISVEKPKLNIEVKKYYNKNLESCLLFYPAGGEDYKNHYIIIKALENLESMYLKKIKVIFTLRGNENNSIKKLKKRVIKNSLPVVFTGELMKEEVFEYYSKSILLFPSYLETLGLPLLEAKLHRAPILASNCKYALEALEGYEDAKFFNPFCALELEDLIKEKIIKNYGEE